MAEATPNPAENDDNPWKKLNVPVQDADTLRQEAVEAHHDHLITEIETSEGPLATTLRAVYDGQDIEYFMEKLDARIKNHDHEIERMCNYHYQGFIDSIRELQQVSGDATKLKNNGMVVSRKQELPIINIYIKGTRLKQKDQFKYLGSLISSDGRNNSEVASRIAQAKTNFQKMKTVLTNKNISIRTRRRALECYIEPILMYGCEAWTISKQTQKKLEATEMWFLRRMLRISWTAKKTNDTVLEEAHTTRLLISKIRKRQATFFGHVMRREKLENLVTTGMLEGKRSRGKQREKLIEGLTDWLKAWKSLEAIEATKDRKKWRTMIANAGEIQGLNRDIQASCDPLLSKGDQLVKCQKVQKNVTQAIESLSLCLPVLEMYGKLQEQMKSKRYYPALKTLEQLEHTYLPRVINHWFSQTMSEAIPRLRERIKEASMTELKDFLESIRKHSAKIGEVAMRHAAEQNNMDPKIAEKRVKKRRAPPPPNPFTGEVEHDPSTPASDGDDNEEELSAQDLVDFSPVYRCLHIYTVLGDKEKFESYYRAQRWKQARLSLQPPPNMHESLDLFKRYFHDIIGFFVVEDHILHTTQGLVTRSHMDELWEKAVEKLSATLRSTSARLVSNGTAEQSCKMAYLMLEVKKLIVLFCHTLKGYGFSVGRLLELLLEMRDRYSVILSEQWVQVFNDIFAEDNYTPIMCETPEDYLMVTSQFPYKDKDLEKSEYPRQIPFSQFVPSVFVQVKEYINACLKFSADLHLSHTEIDDMIRKSANQLLMKTLGGCLSNLIKKPKLSLLQLIQISINMNYLEKSCEYLEEYISSITGAQKDSVHIARLHGSAMFKDARSDAEQHIYQQLNLKIDEFLDLASYDWVMLESKGQASSYLMDLIAFLQSTFMSFTNLPIFHTSWANYV
ncbi:exocyst complex component, partial [Plakobranchus ocellatus]